MCTFETSIEKIDPRVKDIFHSPSNSERLVDHISENNGQLKVILKSLLSMHKLDTSTKIELVDHNHAAKLEIIVNYLSGLKSVWVKTEEFKPDFWDSTHLGVIADNGTYLVENLTEKEKKVKFIVDIQQIFVEFCEERKLTKQDN